jgi:N-formylglutamate amidohydrolase
LETLASSVASRAVPPGVVAANWERVTAGEPMALVWSLLASLLESVRARWGAVLLIDLHSMPPLPARAGELAAEFVVGDRFGAACDGALVAEAFSALGQARRLAAHNRPYAGGYVLERHARRHGGVHCLQLEIDRRTYLDAALAEPGPGLGETVDVVAMLVQRMAIAVADLGRERGYWHAAAE